MFDSIVVWHKPHEWEIKMERERERNWNRVGEQWQDSKHLSTLSIYLQVKDVWCRSWWNGECDLDRHWETTVVNIVHPQKCQVWYSKKKTDRRRRLRRNATIVDIAVRWWCNTKMQSVARSRGRQCIRKREGERKRERVLISIVIQQIYKWWW